MEEENLLEKGFPFPPPNHPPFPPKAFVMGEGSGRDLTEGLFFVFLNFFRAASPPVESLGKMRGGGPGEGRRKPFSIKVPSPLPRFHTYHHRSHHARTQKAPREGDFTLASGRKSDYYFDCRQTALHPEGSWLIGTLFNELLADLDIKGIGGMTLGADPLISATTVISHEKGRPLAGLIVRKESKGHGTNQYVEGLSNFKPGDPVAMVEDVVTTGGSLLKACERVKDAGLNVVAVCTVLDRGEGGREAIEAAGYQLRALFTRPELVELAKED